VVAAFDLGEFLRVFGKGSKILLLKTWLLPLTLASLCKPPDPKAATPLKIQYFLS
jgi:hypothetical protein